MIHVFSHAIANVGSVEVILAKGKRKFSEHVTLVLQTLQWLPIALRLNKVQHVRSLASWSYTSLMGLAKLPVLL